MGTGKKKIEIKRVEMQERRMVTFSKRKNGLFKKAHELHCLTGAHVAAVAFSPAGRPFVHGDPSFEAVIEKYLNREGGDDSKARAVTSWLEGVHVEAYGSVEELMLVKRGLEEIREKVAGVLKIGGHEDFVGSLLVQS